LVDYGALRVLVANNYPLEPGIEGAMRGTYPRAHVWGVDALARDGFEVVLASGGAQGRWLPVHDWLTPLTQRFVWRIGDIEQELFVMSRARRTTIVYAADQVSLRGLSLLRAAHLFPAPIVTVVHHPIELTQTNRSVVNGIDIALCLSRRVRGQLIRDFGRPPSTTLFAPWGPDLSAPFYSARAERFVVSTGKTQRDIDTLLSAVATAEYPVRVHSRMPRGSPGANTEIITPPASSPVGLVDFLEVMDDLRDAAVVAIPIANTDTVVGLTELNDALALGKPVVMTKNEFIDVDIEAIGCGISVAPGDTEGWRRALDSLMGNPSRRRAMGRAGREFAVREWNYELFCEQLTLALDRVQGLDSSRPARPQDVEPSSC
jgi:glycosyltransferase involved in cell wall biosynthesis